MDVEPLVEPRSQFAIGRARPDDWGTASCTGHGKKVPCSGCHSGTEVTVARVNLSTGGGSNKGTTVT
jgi:hypothetical protein